MGSKGLSEAEPTVLLKLNPKWVVLKNCIQNQFKHNLAYYISK